MAVLPLPLCPMSQSRCWMFTQNNYTRDDEDVLMKAECKYMLYGYEVGEQGTPHLQGYVVFECNKRMSAVKQILPRAHWEIRRGTHEQASEYCKKDGHFIEKGEPPMSKRQQGDNEIARWDAARESAKLGKFDDIPSDIYFRYTTNAHKIHALAQVVPASQSFLDFYWFYGATGTGKSKRARDENPGYYVKQTNKWWDGYTDQPCVIIEEWSPEMKMLGNYLKQWCDHHPFSAEIKGGTKCIRPPKIIITSNYSIDECFDDPNVILPLKRRIQIKHFN